jgi:hypothetical protein
MAHCEKYVRADTGGIFIHFDRTPGHPLSNKDIDHTRTHLNYNLASEDQPMDQKKFLANRLKQIQTNGRKTQNVICDWIVTQPGDVREQDSRKFFHAVYEHLSDKYGRKNVVSAYVHMDEVGNTPHVHFCFVPVETLPDGTEKLNAKAIINREALRAFHPELQKVMDEKMGYHISISSGITAAQGGNKTVKELKEETAAIQAQLPAGKENFLKTSVSFTKEETAKLQQLAAEGVAHQVEKEKLKGQKAAVTMAATKQNEKRRALEKKEKTLSERDRDLENLAAELKAPDARTYAATVQENHLLHEDIQTIAENVGRQIMDAIPDLNTEIDHTRVFLPSEPVMAVIQRYVSAATKQLKEQLDKVYQLLQNAVTYVRNIAVRHPDPDLSNTASKMEEDLYQIHEEIYQEQPSLLKQLTKKKEHTLSHRL